MENELLDGPLKEINEWLAKSYGYATEGKPWYRVVRAALQTEKRFGQFNDYLPGTDILLRREIDVREVLKYWYLHPDTFVIEKWIVFPKPDKELMDNARYEPIWSLIHSRSGMPLPLRKDVVEVIVHFAQTGHAPGVPGTQAEADSQRDEVFKQEAVANRDMLDNESTKLQSQFRQGEAVIIHREDDNVH